MNNSFFKKYSSALWGFLAALFVAVPVIVMIYAGSDLIARQIIGSQVDVDDLISEWTTPSDVTIEAGMAARRELPDAAPMFFPDTVRALAAMVEELYSIPKGVVLAQWALESKWGRANLGVSNYFGHTCAAVRPYRTDATTPYCIKVREKVVKDGTIALGDSISFASYPNIETCFLTHGRYLSGSPLYLSAFTKKSPEAFARAIARRYATDPDYAFKLILIMRRFKLS